MRKLRKVKRRTEMTFQNGEMLDTLRDVLTDRLCPTCDTKLIRITGGMDMENEEFFGDNRFGCLKCLTVWSDDLPYECFFEKD